MSGKRHKIQQRLILVISLLTVVGMVLLVFLTMSQSVRVYETQAVERVIHEAQGIAYRFEDKLNVISTKLNTFTQLPDTSLDFPEDDDGVVHGSGRVGPADDRLRLDGDRDPGEARDAQA
ncbi:MAG: hypothetical protein PQJ58_16345, partial [Spirochaetales bacterium]|nr:hypothetical protein [Spirochaetales bacterium]